MSGIKNLSVKEFFACMPPNQAGIHKLKTDSVAPVKTLFEIEKSQQIKQSNDSSSFDTKSNTNNLLGDVVEPSPLTAFLKGGQFTDSRENGNKFKFQSDTIKQNQVDSDVSSSQVKDKKNSVTTKPSLMPPTMFTAVEKTNYVKLLSELTKSQLIDSLLYLIQNDEDFHEKLYKAYLETVNKVK